MKLSFLWISFLFFFLGIASVSAMGLTAMETAATSTMTADLYEEVFSGSLKDPRICAYDLRSYKCSPTDPTAPQIVFNNDQTQWAYIRTELGRSVVVLNGHDMATFEEVQPYLFFNAKNELVYTAKQNGKYALVIGAMQTPWYVSVGYPAFSTKGDVAYSFSTKEGIYGWNYNGKIMSGTYTSDISVWASEDIIITQAWDYTQNTISNNPVLFAINGETIGDNSAAVSYFGFYGGYYGKNTSKKNAYHLYTVAKEGKIALVKRSLTGVVSTGKFMSGIVGYPTINMQGTKGYYTVSDASGMTTQLYTLDGKNDGKIYQSISNIYMTGPTGNKLYMTYQMNDKWYVRIGENTYGAYDSVEYIQSYNMGYAWSIAVKKAGKSLLLVNGKEISLSKKK